MSSTNKTTYYELPQFVDNDIFNPLVDDNDAYSKIDTALHNIANAEADDASEIVSVKSRLDSAEGDIDTLEAQNGNSVLTTTAQTLSGAVNELDADTGALDGRLDIVEDDINNASTGLKAKVSALETQNGSEVLTTTAQTLSGAVNELDAEIGNDILKTTAQTLAGAINENFDKINTYDSITTPEQYGAIGDDVADDTVAVQSAISAGRMCVMNGTYKTTQPIEIGRHKHVLLNGTIHYTGSGYAIHVLNDPQIYGSGSIVSDGAGVITNNLQPLRFAIIEGLILWCETEHSNLIFLESSGSSNSVTNNRLVRLKLSDGGDAENVSADNGIYLHTTNEGYINENRFEQIHFEGCDFAIKMYIEANHYMNRNQFEQVTTENSAHALYAKTDTEFGVRDCVFDFRTEEMHEDTDQFQVDEYFLNNVFYGNYETQLFKALGDTTPTSVLTTATVRPNIIYGALKLTNLNNPSMNSAFIARGNIMNFDINFKSRSSYLTDTDGVCTLSYDGTGNNAPGFKIHRLGPSRSALTINLNQVSNYFFSPLKFISIENTSGTDVTIVDGDTTIMPTTHLAQGIHELTYTAGNEIVVLY